MENKFNKKKVLMVILAALAVTVVLGSMIAFSIKGGRKGSKNVASGIGDALSADEDAKLNEQIDKEIDEYLKEFSKTSSFTEVMTSEDKAPLGGDIFTELSKDNLPR